jgi:virginiamycin A acetyltransferase
MREDLKAAAFWLATLATLPALVSYAIRSTLLGRDRALEGSTQALALVPGLAGQYMRRAFLCRVLDACDRSVTVEFGTLFSSASATLDAAVYIGPRCHLGMVQIGRGALLGAGVHVPSGRSIHGTETDRPIQQQPLTRERVHIGEGAWIGSAAVVMADVGAHTIVGAGSVVTTSLPSWAVAAGVPARVIRTREQTTGAGN